MNVDCINFWKAKSFAVERYLLTACIPLYLVHNEKHFSVIQLPLDMSVHSMPNEKASLLPTPFIIDLVWSIITGSSYMATWQSGKCFGVPAQLLTCLWRLPGKRHPAPLRVSISISSLERFLWAKWSVSSSMNLASTQELEMTIILLCLLHLDPIPLLIFVDIKSLGPGFRCPHFCELWFWDPIYSTALSLVS